MIKVAHSPDNDDLFYFWPIVENLIELEGLSFSFESYHTEQLNVLAKENSFDVIAISTAVYSAISEKYLILSSGASVGRNYGPTLVSINNYSLEQLNSLVIGIPGPSTTAALVLKHLAPKAKTITIPILPYSAVFAALENKSVDAAVLIHEGQISYLEHGLNLVCDLGQWWFQQTSLPLVLGLNVISRKLESSTIAKTARVISRSIEFAYQNIDAACDYLQSLPDSPAKRAKLSNADLKKYLNMYANADSLKLTADAIKGIEKLLPDTKVQLAD